METPNTELIPLSQALGAHLKDRRFTVATAESCTGGLIADAITDVSGASDYFRGGVIAYSSHAKEKLLGIAADLLRRETPYSPEVARQMALGARRLFEADLGLGVTGIAGPGGELPGKPVGTIYIAVATSTRDRVESFHFSYDRRGNKLAAAVAGLRLLLAFDPIS